MNLNDSNIYPDREKPPLLSHPGNTDKFIFTPKKHYGFAKGFFILCVLVVWAFGVMFCLSYNTTDVQERETAQPQEEMFDWKPIPGKKFPS